MESYKHLVGLRTLLVISNMAVGVHRIFTKQTKRLVSSCKNIRSLQTFFWVEKHSILLLLSGLHMETFGQASMTSQNTLCPRLLLQIRQIGKTVFFLKA